MDTFVGTRIVFLLSLAWLSLAACSEEDRSAPGASGESGEAEGISSLDETGQEGPPEQSSGPKLDLASDYDAGDNVGDCGSLGGGEAQDAFSIIWIANSSEGTVSKVDTETATEIARFRTGPGDDPDPSRTSVNLFGEVAVANRSGSVTKIAARLEDCIDANLDGEITTSSGPEDVLEWGADECVLWHHEVGFDIEVAGHQGGPRAVAWDAGTEGPEGCPHDPKLWVGWRAQPAKRVVVRRLDGASAEVEGEVEIDDWQQNWGHGTYGGATDIDRNFWGLGTGGTLIRVDAGSFEVSRFDNPEPDRVVYGIALDGEGNPWLAGWDGTLWRFEVESETWEDRGQVGSGARLRGLAIDQDGHAWLAANQGCGLVRYDTLLGETLAAHIELPGCDEPVGVSVDREGAIWVVDRAANTAFRVDPDSQLVDASVTGLVDPYTYSDMTGAGLDVVVNPRVG